MSMEPLDQENPYPAVKHLLDPILHDEYIKIAQRNQLESPLLRLPIELRRQIFGYVLGDEVIGISAKRASIYESRSRLPFKTTYGSKKIDILSVCHQIYVETRFLPFELNTFCTYKGVWAFNKWLDALAVEQRAAVKSIQIPAWIQKYKLDYVPGLPPPYEGLKMPDPKVHLLPGLTRVEIMVGIVRVSWKPIWTIFVPRPLGEWAEMFTERVRGRVGKEVLVSYQLDEEPKELEEAF